MFPHTPFRFPYPLILLLLLSLACQKEEVIPEEIRVSITTDKARYAPGETVSFSISRELPAEAQVRYKYLHQTVDTEAYSGRNWTWTTPDEDYRGYLVELYSPGENGDLLHGTIAVDVSSDWTRFPRYGFLSKYGEDAPVEDVIQRLNRYHINGLQFYDWHYKHHDPLAGTGDQPQSSWEDIIGRTNYLATVQAYIAEAHTRNMQAMSYNLAYGATNTAGADGVQADWYIYQDATASSVDFHPLPQPPFSSDIFLVNPANPDWQNYLAARNDEIYMALNFDGYHIDQLGNRGQVYNQAGELLILRQTFPPFVEAMHAAHPDKYYVFNAVDQYGQSDIAGSPVDFLYTEVWDQHPEYADLGTLLRNNAIFSGAAGKPTVLAAYMNYDLAANGGEFNTPAVLLTDAVIFAFGGAHIELGEHMLGREYFPEDKLRMSATLEDRLVGYYDFLTAYQNILRDGGEFYEPDFTASVPAANWPPQPGQVAVVGKQVGEREVLHLLNFSGIQQMDWRDTNGTKPAPPAQPNIEFNLQTDQTINRVWVASPDIVGGHSREIDFTQSGNTLSFTVPDLFYWTMVVLEP